MQQERLVDLGPVGTSRLGHELGAATNSFVFVAPGGNHGSKISLLTAADQVTAWQAIETWVGTPRVTPPSLRSAPAVVEENDDVLKYRPRL